MTPVNTTNPLADLQLMLSASRQNYEACISHVEHDHVCEGVTATTRLHHLKFNANGQPKVADLAMCLVHHAIDYAISARNRPSVMTTHEAARYMQEARKLFRVVTAPTGTTDLAGEAGELLLYFLLEAVLGAPQVVAKIELKTNPSLEVNGSDGIHMRWHPSDRLVDVYFGESKLYTDVGAALTSPSAASKIFMPTECATTNSPWLRSTSRAWTTTSRLLSPKSLIRGSPDRARESIMLA